MRSTFSGRSHTYLIDDHYQLGIKSAHTRLLQHLRRLPEVLKEYDAIVRDQLSQGVVELIQEAEVTTHTHNLPNHAVLQHHTDTMKLVYDDSLKTAGPLMNNCLYVGLHFGWYIFGHTVISCTHASTQSLHRVHSTYLLKVYPYLLQHSQYLSLMFMVH